MEKKYITKKDIGKLLKENGLIPYTGGNGESPEQYTGNENSTKMLYTKIHDVEWSSNRVPDDGHNYYEGRVEIDWGIQLAFTENSFRYKPFIKSVIGTLRVYKYGHNDEKIKKDYPFNSKGYRMDIDPQELTKDGVLAITSVVIDMDQKSIVFGHYKMNSDYDPNEDW